MRAPVLLAPDNLTSPSRTPWGGRRIARVLKAGQLEGDPIVGESWELSAGPELPSRIDGAARTLDEMLRESPAMLGREAPRGGTALLVKLLDAASPLSVQIHPRDDYEGLEDDESGKPESWYVEHAEPGAGLFLGLAEGATRASIAGAIERGEDVSALLAFVPVQAGDFVVVDAGTPHAIGAGVTLVEPQRVVPGKRGVTYRYWDWNRRYDADVRLSAGGTPRALHVEHALAVTDWSRARGDAFLREVRHRAGAPDLDARPRLEALCGPEGAPVASDALEVWRLQGTGGSSLPPMDALRSITVLDGTVRVGELRIERGRSAAIPASSEALPLACERACAILAAAC
ncbi:MAG: class I mannose-6-phosphate isomerase [Myxococcota bacterium]|nr:class I mannose-6-phosphate isomerase [Myxococcota bacterium]